MDSNVIVIKRYPNRKLYDTNTSAYVTLEDIGKLIKEGCQIKVIDNKSKLDITYITMVQILFERERRNLNSSSVNLLMRVIRSEVGIFSEFTKSLENKLSITSDSSEVETSQILPELTDTPAVQETTI